MIRPKVQSRKSKGCGEAAKQKEKKKMLFWNVAGLLTKDEEF